MKQLFLSFLFCLFVFTNVKAQTYAEYFNQFPLINKSITWDTGVIDEYHEKGKPALDKKFYGLIGGKGNGKGKWGNPEAYSFSPLALYPLGRVEVGGCVYVFILQIPSSYEKQYQNKATIDMFYYDKKTGNLLRGGMNFMFAFLGSNGASYYRDTVTTDGKMLTLTNSDGTTIYKLRSSGTDLISKK